jgi:hypothetical protein
MDFKKILDKLTHLGGKQTLNESAKPDFLDIDKDGNKKEPFKKAVADRKEHKVTEAEMNEQGMTNAEMEQLVHDGYHSLETIAKWANVPVAYVERIASAISSESSAASATELNVGDDGEYNTDVRENTASNDLSSRVDSKLVNRIASELVNYCEHVDTTPMDLSPDDQLQCLPRELQHRLEMLGQDRTSSILKQAEKQAYTQMLGDDGEYNTDVRENTASNDLSSRVDSKLVNRIASELVNYCEHVDTTPMDLSPDDQLQCLPRELQHRLEMLGQDRTSSILKQAEKQAYTQMLGDDGEYNTDVPYVRESKANDYFKRREDEEGRIAGTKSPAKNKPKQTDYEKKRKKEPMKKAAADKKKPGVAESCGMMSDQDSGMNINSSIDTRTGSKTVSVTASGSSADDLMQILKLSGMGGALSTDQAQSSGGSIRVIGLPFGSVGGSYTDGYEQSVEETYANEPNEQVQPLDTQLRQGTDLNKEKTMHKHSYRQGDNPMAMAEAKELARLESEIMEGLDSIKVKKEVTEGSAHSYNVVKWYAKWNDQLKLTKWLRKEAGLPKNAPVYFDDADLVYGDKTIVRNALVDPNIKFIDLLNAVAQASGGNGKHFTQGVYRAQDVTEGSVAEAVRVMGKTSTGSSMSRMPKGMPGAQDHRDATAKMVKQVRASGQTLRKDSPTAVGSATTGKWKLPDRQVMKYDSKDVRKESEEVDEAVRAMGSASKWSSMSRMPKGMPGAQDHRDATAKMVKQVRASGQTLRKDRPTPVGDYGQRVMKYDSKDVRKESVQSNSTNLSPAESETAIRTYKKDLDSAYKNGESKQRIRQIQAKVDELMAKQKYANEKKKQSQKVAESGQIDESIMEAPGDTLTHIINRFKHEVKQFEETGLLDDDLYDELYDYYSSNGEMPYGVAKARTGDPYQWVSGKLGEFVDSKELGEEVDPLTIPAYKRKHNSRLGGIVQPATNAPKRSIHPENIPAVHRKAANKDFPVANTSGGNSSIDIVRKMAGLPPR